MTPKVGISGDVSIRWKLDADADAESLLGDIRVFDQSRASIEEPATDPDNWFDAFHEGRAHVHAQGVVVVVLVEVPDSPVSADRTGLERE